MLSSTAKDEDLYNNCQGFKMKQLDIKNAYLCMTIIRAKNLCDNIERTSGQRKII